jgi:hypothetical protein
MVMIFFAFGCGYTYKLSVGAFCGAGWSAATRKQDKTATVIFLAAGN